MAIGDCLSFDTLVFEIDLRKPGRIVTRRKYQPAACTSPGGLCQTNAHRELEYNSGPLSGLKPVPLKMVHNGGTKSQDMWLITF